MTGSACQRDHEVVARIPGRAAAVALTPGFGDTTDFVQIKRHYYQTQDWINPSRIVPKGPYVNWLSPHDRERMSGRS